ncbi:MAG: glycosyltransferase family 87 protein [Chloroflexota bacterium]
MRSWLSRRLPWVIAVGAVAGAFQLVQIAQRSPYVWHDFTQDHVAVREAFAGRNPYLPQNSRIAELFGKGPPEKEPAYSFHPPTTLVFFVPLVALDYRDAFVAWMVVSAAAMGWIGYVVLVALGQPGRPWLAAGLGLTLVNVWPLRENFIEGQLNVVVAAAIAAYWLGLRRGAPALSGIALAAAVALKPLAAVFVLYAFWRLQIKVLAWSAVAMALFAVAGVALAGLEGTATYVSTAYPLHAALWPGYHDNASPEGLFTRLFGPTPWKPWPLFPVAGLAWILTLATWGLALALLFACLGRGRPEDERLDAELAALGCTMLLVTPIIWPHYYVVLVAPLAVLTAQAVRRVDRVGLAILLVSVLILMIPRNELTPRLLGTIHLPALIAIYVQSLRALRAAHADRGAPRRSAQSALARAL